MSRYFHTVCVCDACTAQGARELFATVEDKVRQFKMEPFIRVSSIRLKENHPGPGLYLTYDGRPIREADLRDFYKLIKPFDTEALG